MRWQSRVSCCSFAVLPAVFLVFLILWAGLIGGCRPRPSSAGPAASPAETGATAAASSAETGAAPAAGQGGSHVSVDCLVDAYAGCDATRGLPALSADGARVAVPDFGPDSPRDERILTVHILDIDRNAVVRSMFVLGYEDHAQGVDGMTGAVSPALRATLEQRIAAVDQVLNAGGFRPLLSLGRVHEARPGPEVAGMQATFDGTTLTVFDLREGRVRWRRDIGPSPVWKPDPGLDLVCGPFPVADIEVWASREPSVLLAHVTYIGADLCATEYPYMVWR